MPISSTDYPIRTNDGVLFDPADYAGFPRRLAILAIDGALTLFLAVFLLVLYVLANAYYYQQYQDLIPPAPFVLLWFALCWLYLAVIERTDVGTIGFLINDVKIVNLRGERPSVVRMTFRLLLWTLWPFNVFYDLFWLAGDAQKQSLRDKLAGTLVVRRHAEPARYAPIQWARLTFMGWNLMFYEVKK